MDPALIGAIVVGFFFYGGVSFWLGRRSVGQIAESDPKLLQDGSADKQGKVPSTPAQEDDSSGVGALFLAALGRTRETLQGGLGALFGRAVDEELFDELEMALLMADVGMPTTDRLLNPLRDLAKSGESDPDVLRDTLRADMRALLKDCTGGLNNVPESGLMVILVVGVNGSGKTTTIGKLAHRYAQAGKKVLLAAGDTYRAAAGEQLAVWAERAGADFVMHKDGADPAAVVYDAVEKALARGHDLVIIDTAGRLQTKKPLMDQLAKIRRVIDKKVPGAPHETLLVVDGTIGQNAMSQAKLFNEATPLTGVVVTKLDGTAKGGMVLSLAAELTLPVKLVGVGEAIEDLRDFDGAAFVSALA